MARQYIGRLGFRLALIFDSALNFRLELIAKMVFLVGVTKLTNLDIRWTSKRARTFAQFSGDWNPLHIDGEYARRTQFGHPVAHGMDVMLASLNHAFSILSIDSSLILKSAKVFFHAPLGSDQPISVLVTSKSANQIAMTILQDGVRLQHYEVVMERLTPAPPPAAKMFPNLLAADNPREIDLEKIAGSFEWGFEPELCDELYLNLTKRLPAAQIAALGALSRAVGMHLPGRQALFVRASIEFSETDDCSEKVDFNVLRFDKRYHMLDGQVSGPGFVAKTQSMLRPTPVAQSGLRLIKELVPEDAFLGLEALVVGGSRGVGEAISKILAVGGAKVSLTYSQGRSDGTRVCSEIESNGGSARRLQLDVLANAGEIANKLHDIPRPDWIFYCASPLIMPSNQEDWDVHQFENYRNFYVLGPFRLAEAIKKNFPASTSNINFFTPSSVFVDQPPRNFREYAKAKAEAETIAGSMAAIDNSIISHYARLPRMETDQNAGVDQREIRPTTDVLIPILLAKCGLTNPPFGA